MPSCESVSLPPRSAAVVLLSIMLTAVASPAATPAPPAETLICPATLTRRLFVSAFACSFCALIVLSSTIAEVSLFVAMTEAEPAAAMPPLPATPAATFMARVSATLSTLSPCAPFSSRSLLFTPAVKSFLITPTPTPIPAAVAALLPAAAEMLAAAVTMVLPPLCVRLPCSSSARELLLLPFLLFAKSS